VLAAYFGCARGGVNLPGEDSPLSFSVSQTANPGSAQVSWVIYGEQVQVVQRLETAMSALAEEQTFSARC